MSQSVWGYWLIALGIGVITVMMLVQNYTTINQEDYYLLKEVTQASMNDAIDFSHYMKLGELKINREKFIENFIRRFSESVKGNKNYKLDFYDIYETPPKVSVKVSTKTSSFNVSGDTMDLDVTNSIDAILENNSTNTITKVFYSVPYQDCPESKQDYLGYCTITNSPMLSQTGIIESILKIIDDYGISGVSSSDLNIISAKYIGNMENKDFEEYYNNYELTYGKPYTDVNHRSPRIGEANLMSYSSYDTLIADELKNVKLTVTDNNILAWSGKFKCSESSGFPSGTEDIPTDGTEANNISGQCLLGIKYELKFSY